jgi:hypothetical protein
MEEMPRSPAFRLMMRLSFRSHLAILHFVLRLAHGTPPLAPALFRLKIASSERGASTRTRCAHLNCNDKETEESAEAEDLREDQRHNKEHRTIEMYREDGDSQIF